MCTAERFLCAGEGVYASSAGSGSRTTIGTCLRRILTDPDGSPQQVSESVLMAQRTNITQFPNFMIFMIFGVENDQIQIRIDSDGCCGVGFCPATGSSSFFRLMINPLERTEVANHRSLRLARRPVDSLGRLAGSCALRRDFCVPGKACMLVRQVPAVEQP